MDEAGMVFTQTTHAKISNPPKTKTKKQQQQNYKKRRKKYKKIHKTKTTTSD